MKAKKTNNQKKPDTAKFFFPCGDSQRMAEMMKNCCPSEGDAIDCCSMMIGMMGHGKGVEPEEAKGTQKAPKGGENG